MAFTRQPSETTEQSRDRGDFRPEHGQKLAQRVAEQIEKDVVGAGWPVGHSLGRESDLLERYPVSRAVLREAIAIAEQDGIVQMRRGVRGGLFVIAPAQNTVILALRNYLEAAGISIDELQFAREAIDGLMLQLAARKLNPVSMQNLRALASESSSGRVSLASARALLEAIATAAENPILSIFVAALAQLGVSLTYYRGATQKQVNRHLQTALAIRHAQIEALIANDLAALLATLPQQAAALDALHVDMASRRNVSSPARDKSERLMQRLLDMGEVSRKVKLADVVALQLQADIIQRGWPIGERLGSEAELINRLGVSRGSFREAIRALERLGVVRTASGRHGGGLYVAAPNPAQTIRRTLLYLGHGQMSMETVTEVDEAISLAAITSLAKCVAANGPSHLDPLRSTTEQLDGLSVEQYARNGYLKIAELCGNRVLSLFMHILSGLTALRPLDHKSEDKKNLKKIATAHLKIIDALTAGDINIARRWMMELRKLITQEHPVSRSARELIERKC